MTADEMVVGGILEDLTANEMMLLYGADLSAILKEHEDNQKGQSDVGS